MLWILFVMGTIVAIVLAIIVGGLATPREHTVARSIVLPVSMDRVWQTIHDVGNYNAWRHELEDAEIVDTNQPQLRWRETSTRGSVTFGVTADEPPQRFAARILDEDLPFSGEWTWRLDTDGSTTRVSITERGAVGNPLFRFFAAHVMGYTKSLDGYLSALAAHLGSPNVTITDAKPG